jgi:hypothetical protein
LGAFISAFQANQVGWEQLTSYRMPKSYRDGLLVLILMIAACQSCCGAPGDVTAELMAAPSATSPYSPGKAFLCITTQLDSRVKQERYGLFAGSKTGEPMVGGSTLDKEFKQQPTRPAHLAWTLKQPITEEQHQAFLDLVEKVNTGNYPLTASNCNDFVHDVVDALGWTNVRKGLAFETYVRELYTAAIKEFDYTGTYGGEFKMIRDEDSWQAYKNGERYATLRELGHNARWIVLRWEAKKTSIRLPLKGGPYEFQTGPATSAWYKGKPVTVRL